MTNKGKWLVLAVVKGRRLRNEDATNCKFSLISCTEIVIEVAVNHVYDAFCVA